MPFLLFLLFLLFGEREERGLQRGDHGRQFTHRDLRPHHLGHESIERGHQRPYDEHLVAVARPAVLDDPDALRLGRQPACGRGIGGEQSVLQLPVLGGQFGERAGEDNPSGGEDGHLRAQRLDVVHPVAGEHHTRAVRREPVQDTVHMPLARRVEAVGGLVQDEQPGPGEQGGGEPEPLPHAEREAAHPVVGDLAQTDLGEHFPDPRRVRVAPAQRYQRGQVLPGGQRRVQARPVDETGHSVNGRKSAPDRHAEDLQSARVGDGEPQQQAEQRCLPGPVRPDQAMDLTLGHIQVDTVERDHITEALRDPARPHREHCVHELLLRDRKDRRRVPKNPGREVS
ncbi:hypothetical protein GPN2_13955 [Streptomyces murinus]